MDKTIKPSHSKNNKTKPQHKQLKKKIKTTTKENVILLGSMHYTDSPLKQYWGNIYQIN